MWTAIPGSLGLTVLGLVVLTSVRILYGTGEGSEGDPVRVAMNVAGAVLLVLGLLGGCMVAMPFWSVQLSIAMFIVVSMSVSRYRTTQKRTLLSIMAIAAEKGIPLQHAVTAFAREKKGHAGVLAARLAELLEQGVSLDDAVKGVRGALPAGTETAARIGQETGKLGEALGQLATSRTETDAIWRTIGGRLLYIFGLLVCVFAASLFLLLFIMPPLLAVYADYQTPLPVLTSYLYGLVATPAVWTISFFFILLIGAIVLYVGLLYVGFVRWTPPLLQRLVIRLEAADSLRMLALVADAGKPLLGGVRVLADTHLSRPIRRRFKRVEREVSAGADWCDSMRRFGLLSEADLILLKSARRVGNLSWAMRESAASSERRIMYRVQAMAQLFFPILLLAVGSFVCILVVGFFMPMVDLTQRMVP